MSECVKTSGTLELKGKVIDEATGELIPGRSIIVQGLLEINNEQTMIDIGQFASDSSGKFRFSLEKVRDARYYDFHLVGDSDYALKTRRLSLPELEQNSKYLFFSLSKLEGVIIKIRKDSKITGRDTLYLSWQSDRVDFRTLYPYEITDVGINDKTLAYMPGFGLRLIGGRINSIIKTRVFADKLTILHWELVRNKKRNEFTDTLICKRGQTHTINFTY